MQAYSDQEIQSLTQKWVEKIVIGLNLCPFAKAVYVKKQIRYSICHATTVDELCLFLNDELNNLIETDAAITDTTLIIHPFVLLDFLDFNDFLDVADEILEMASLEDEIQIASFHPQYQFSGTEPNDIENYTNRSPFPILQLLREKSVEKAVAAFPDAHDIFNKNIKTMKSLGHQGWDELNKD